MAHFTRQLSPAFLNPNISKPAALECQDTVVPSRIRFEADGRDVISKLIRGVRRQAVDVLEVQPTESRGQSPVVQLGDVDRGVRRKVIEGSRMERVRMFVGDLDRLGLRGNLTDITDRWWVLCPVVQEGWIVQPGIGHEGEPVVLEREGRIKGAKFSGEALIILLTGGSQ